MKSLNYCGMAKDRIASSFDRLIQGPGEPEMSKAKVFIAYARADKELRKELIIPFLIR